MSAKLQKTLFTAHVNSLEKTLGALEVQVTYLKAALKELKGGKAEDDDTDADEDEAEETPKKTKKKSKKASDEDDADGDDDGDADSDDEEENADDEDEESDEDSGDDENEDDGPKKGKGKKDALSEKQIAKLTKAFQAYAKEHDRKKALKVLKSFGVSAIRDLSPDDYEAALEKVSE